MTQTTDFKFLKDGYTLESVGITYWTKNYKHIYLGYHEDHMYFKCQPTPKQVAAFRVWWAKKRMGVSTSKTDLETRACQEGKSPQWKGSLLTVGEEMYEFSPVPHVAESRIQLPCDEQVATIATIMLRGGKENATELAISPSTVNDGPLSSLMTEESVVNYALTVGEFLDAKGVTDKHDETFARQTYDAIRLADKFDRLTIRQATYNLFAKMDLKVKGNGATMDPAFEVEGTKIEIAVKGKDRFAVPQLELKRYTGRVRVMPQKVEKKKDPVEMLMAQLTSRFPARLVKYHGYRGFPGKAQREFLELRPFFDVAVICNPSVNLKSWMEANGHAGSIRVASDATVNGNLQEHDVLISRNDYNEHFNPIRPAFFFGSIKFDSAFWSHYSIIFYRPPSKNQFVFCQKNLDLSKLPKTYGGYKLTICESQKACSQFLSNYLGSLVAMIFKGTYNAKSAFYDNLKYPIAQKNYEILETIEDVNGEIAKEYVTAARAVRTLQLQFDDDVASVTSTTQTQTVGNTQKSGVVQTKEQTIRSPMLEVGQSLTIKELPSHKLFGTVEETWVQDCKDFYLVYTGMLTEEIGEDDWLVYELSGQEQVTQPYAVGTKAPYIDHVFALHPDTQTEYETYKESFSPADLT